jgi:hypothetical protein
MSLLTRPSVLIYPRSQAPPTIFGKLWPSPTGKRLTLKLNKKYGGTFKWEIHKNVKKKTVPHYSTLPYFHTKPLVDNYLLLSTDVWYEFCPFLIEFTMEYN